MRVHAVFRHKFRMGSGTDTELIALYYNVDDAYASISDKPKNPDASRESEWWTVESHGVMGG